VGLEPKKACRVVILPVRDPTLRFETQAAADAAGQLSWSQPVGWLGEAAFEVYQGKGVRPLAELHAYAIRPEWANRRPLRGDFHMHTTYSDGRHSVAEMVLRGRELGLDVLAVTDHNYYPASQEAIELARQGGLGLLCLPGEEVTAPNWHLISINASGAVGWTRDRDGYEGMLSTIQMIHDKGGKAYLAHPYWTYRNQSHLPWADYERALADGAIDGIELLGDCIWEENLRSVVRYGELPPGQRYPVLGNSDAHTREHTLGVYWTFLLAQDSSPEGVLQAIADGASAACASISLAPRGYPAHARLMAFGPLEMVDLAIFLDREYFPRHDELCRREVELVHRRLSGDEGLEGEIAGVQIELESYRRKEWAA
jgi:hypothetical protein